MAKSQTAQPLQERPELHEADEKCLALRECVVSEKSAERRRAQGMFSLTTWISRCRRSPWKQHGVANTLKEAGKRYLDVVSLAAVSQSLSPRPRSHPSLNPKPLNPRPLNQSPQP